MASQTHDVPMPDAAAANSGMLTEAELDEKFPNRPRNFGPTLPFRELYERLFDPLSAIRKRGGAAPGGARRKAGPQGPQRLSPHEERRAIIERFIARWRERVGNDVYPAFRLIVPDKDRDRPMYGLKEKAIGRLLVRVLRIDRGSDDALALLNFKLPGGGGRGAAGAGARAAAAGDFAARCFEVVRRRPLRTAPTDMTVGEVNDALDALAAAAKEADQAKIVAGLYARMSPQDLMWVVRVVLRQMKVGATERTLFDVWHADAAALYNVSSSLRRVCWELHDPAVRLDGSGHDVALMSCFQPQLAQFQIAGGFDSMVRRLRPVPGDDAFWIEEKLDGERMQMHMAPDPTHPGGRRFAFWSRKAKDYTYLYGDGLQDVSSALTRHLGDAFADGVQSLIVDGEMITWDPAQDKMVPFGTLKTAALAEQRGGTNDGPRPLYAVFDLLLLNGKVLTSYTLRDRRAALEAAVVPVHRRFQLHPYAEAREAGAIEPAFRRVIEEEAEGLVLKNPRAAYRLNARADDWLKVKPDYLGFGETPDVVLVGGYYGSGRRGGALSSFLCGLVAGPAAAGAHDPQLCWSFCKVGGGLTAADYAAIRHATDGKWTDWDAARPPSHVVALAGDQAERPDVWIRPADSVVVELVAASVAPSTSFRAGFTLRFPRFKRLRGDKAWTDALTVAQFFDLKASADQALRERRLEFAQRRPKRARTGKKEVQVLGADEADDDAPDSEADGDTGAFAGLRVAALTGGEGRSRRGVEKLVRAHGGAAVLERARADVVVADRNVVGAAAALAAGQRAVRVAWLLDCIRTARRDGPSAGPLLLPPEPARHLLPGAAARGPPAVDEWGDSFARDTDAAELRAVLLRAERLPRAVADAEVGALRQMLAHRGVGESERAVT